MTNHLLNRSVAAAVLSAGFLFASTASSVDHDSSVTPYGDSCRFCETYGTCRDVLTPAEAVHALEQYYKEKGFSVGILHHRDRFIEADIQRDGVVVDKVLFDRKTGRIRSVY